MAYYRHVKMRAKGRWFGKPLSDIQIELPNAEIIGDLSQILKNKDIVEYKVHVHEPPVTKISPENVIYENNDFMVINKPSGIPVHPTVNYYKNSITEMLGGNLYPCYRLDRLTSGVLILGKNSDFVKQFNNSPKDKIYYAKVERSRFMSYLADKGLGIEHQFTITDPLFVFNAKRGYNKFLEDFNNPKPAKTYIRHLRDEKNLSVLEIRLETGRTHQIRKHLAMHGMPIHNDEIYANKFYYDLWKTGSQQSFDAVWKHAEAVREAKLTGEQCNECGVPLYNSYIAQLDLHCAMYSFDEYVFEAPFPSM